ncbi:hypothetical protein RclHR1_21400001 [Rhizophagus clarus]|uniref:Uncharacterized protein n=1 Tax=Rhizophagus clarus TaxID=94130 RepID=A0A2Z6RLT5_9GLOM|nr:hypothetical protein RclHR1_21400001 [Rhizophagus clarus]
MSPHWSERLLIYNPYKYHLFKHRNRSIITQDNTRKYEVLPLHAKIGIGENLATSSYLNIKVNGYEPEYKNRTWVPIIPGYTIFTKADYSRDKTFANIQYLSRKPDFFASLIARLPGEGIISIPDLLGFNNENNVEFLRSIINAKFLTIFKDFKKNYSTINKGITLKQSCKRKGIAILNDITLSSNSTSNIMSGLILKIEKDKNLQNNHEEEDIDENQNLDHIIDEAISKAKLGSTILIDTRQYLKTLFTQPCSRCYSKSNKKLEVISVGFSVKTRILCNDCRKTTEYKNKTYQNNFGILVSGAGIAGGANCQQMKTIFSTVVTSAAEALEIACSHIVNIEEKVLPVSFDISWSHVRNANQASGELILQKNFLSQSRKTKDQEESQIIYQGNFDKSSHQMEHAILIEVLEKIQPSLDKYDLMLDISVDGDLNSNKTLSSIRSVNKIYGDLKHIGKNIRKKIAKNAVWKDYENVIMKYYTRVVYAATARKEDPDIETPEDQEVLNLQINGLVAHLSGDHSLCWEEFCWHKSNIDLELPEPNLLKHDNNKRASFKSILIEVFRLPAQ